ncbi:hypothetical protein OIU76_020189 [Salix suchowensis]|nr:hypothetical protein OIU76_020189 [Salix suchowensis]
MANLKVDERDIPVEEDVLAADEVFCTGTAVVATSVASASMPESAFSIFQNHVRIILGFGRIIHTGARGLIYNAGWNTKQGRKQSVTDWEGAVGVDLKLGPNRMVSLESDSFGESGAEERKGKSGSFSGCCFLLP